MSGFPSATSSLLSTCPASIELPLEYPLDVLGSAFVAPTAANWANGHWFSSSTFNEFFDFGLYIFYESDDAWS